MIDDSNGDGFERNGTRIAMIIDGRMRETPGTFESLETRLTSDGAMVFAAACSTYLGVWFLGIVPACWGCFSLATHFPN